MAWVWGRDGGTQLNKEIGEVCCGVSDFSSNGLVSGMKYVLRPMLSLVLLLWTPKDNFEMFL